MSVEGLPQAQLCCLATAMSAFIRALIALPGPLPGPLPARCPNAC